MNKPRQRMEPDKAPQTSQMGSDGWFTFFLSNLLIILGLGIGLVWRTYNVLKVARQSGTSVDAGPELILLPCLRLENGQPSGDFIMRLERARALHLAHRAPILLLGGHTGASISEAEAGAAYLRRMGVKSQFLLLEERSRNTLENLHNARALIRERGFPRLVITSNRYHLARCQVLAEGLNLRPQPVAAEPRFQPAPSHWPRLLLEGYYIHWYYTGRLWSRLTRNRHSLARIS